MDFKKSCVFKPKTESCVLKLCLPDVQEIRVVSDESPHTEKSRKPSKWMRYESHRDTHVGMRNRCVATESKPCSSGPKLNIKTDFTYPDAAESNPGVGEFGTGRAE